jgi:hypothetical protein
VFSNHSLKVFEKFGRCKRFFVAILVRFQVLTVASMHMAVFWIVASCSPVDIYHPDDGGRSHF